VPRLRRAGGAGRKEPPGAALAGSPAELLEFAAGQMLREDSAAGALPVLLARLTGLFGCRAALAFQEDADGGLATLAAFPQQAGTKEELPAAITRLTAAHRADTAEHGYFQATLVPGPAPPAGTGESLLMASSPETGGRRLCSIALVGDASHWDASCRATTRALAAIVAAQIRHASDTTELAARQARTEALRETERRFRLMSQLAPVGILQTDLAGRSVFTNDRWREMLGLTDEQARGAHWSDGLHPDDVGRVQEEWEQAARHDGELRTDCRLRPAGDAESWVHMAIKPVPGEDGRPAGWLTALTNVSERKRAEAERERLLAAERAARQSLAGQNARLQELDEARTGFLATVSHELRAPLTSMISFTELILDGTSQLPADTVDALSVIQRNGGKLLRLLGDLLLLSRLEARAVALDVGSVAVPGLIREAVRSVSATAAGRGIEVTASTQDGPLLKADLLRLQQIMDNLLSNAIKFSGRGGKVQVSARPEGQMWRIDVTDEGIGIPAGELGTLFGRFVRGTNARMAGVPGAGLGLSVVKAIAELHGGRVEVESTVGLGSTFSVFLPVLCQPVTA
jgi:PAS domain S-box-containing protein